MNAGMKGLVTAPDTAYARLYGEPLFKLPHDLYIPPDALEVFFETFEGPLDLLLYLIRRQNFNVLDIPMTALTHQYLAYIERIRARNFELAAEYLLMAALLIEIKSRLLLPVRTEEADNGEDEEDPRAELVHRLLEYERIKHAAQAIDALPQLGRDFWPVALRQCERKSVLRWPEVQLEALCAAWADVLRRAKRVERHAIHRETLSVRETMSAIVRRLRNARCREFTELFDPARGVPVAIVSFMAILELARLALIEVTQAEPFAPLYVQLADQSEPLLENYPRH